MITSQVIKKQVIKNQTIKWHHYVLNYICQTGFVFDLQDYSKGLNFCEILGRVRYLDDKNSYNSEVVTTGIWIHEYFLIGQFVISEIVLF